MSRLGEITDSHDGSRHLFKILLKKFYLFKIVKSVYDKKKI